MAQFSQLTQSIIWMLGAMISFTLMAVSGRELFSSLDTFEIMLYRSLVGIFLGALMQHYSIISDKQLYTLLSICLVISGGYVYYRNVWDPILEKEIKQSKVDYLQTSNKPVSN